MGSSSISRSGSATSSRASAARVCSPPDSCERRAAPVLPRDAQPGERLIHALVEVVAVECLEALPEAAYSGACDGLRAVPLQLGQLALQPLDLRGAGPHGRSHGRRADEGRIQVRLLAQQPDARPGRDVDGPAIGVLAARDDPEQRRLAGTVGADQADTLAARERGADRIEDDEVTDLAAHIVQAQDAHALRLPDPTDRRRAEAVEPAGEVGPRS